MFERSLMSLLDSIVIKIRGKPYLASPLGEKKTATNSDVNITQTLLKRNLKTGNRKDKIRTSVGVWAARNGKVQNSLGQTAQQHSRGLKPNCKLHQSPGTREVCPGIAVAFGLDGLRRPAVLGCS